MSPAPVPPWQRWLSSTPAVLLAGGLHTLSFAPFEAWWLQCLALAVLALATASAGPRRAAWLGGCFATGWLVSGLWWLYISMHDHGGLPAWLAAAAVLALSAGLSLYYAGAMALWAWLRGALGGTGGVGVRRSLGLALLWSACWLLAELARGTWLTGFPWIASGYAHAVGPLAAWAPWIGVYGLVLLAGWIAFALAALLRPAASPAARLVPALAGLLLVGLGQVLPAEFTQPSGSLRISLLQPNIAQDIKFDPDRMSENLVRLSRQILVAQGDLVVTPESVIPLTRRELGEDYWANLHAPFKAPGRGLMLGIFLGNETEGFVNSVVGLSAAPEEYHYGKRHLLPFGEFIPPGFGWFVAMMNIPLADQARGRNTAPMAIGGQRLRPLICYEDLFGEDFAASVVGPDAATVLVNFSNLAWFGRLLVQDQHLQFSQLRALEFQRPVVRSTNTGATAVVDHRGQVTARLPAMTEGTLEATVEGRRGDTPYARWLSAVGLWPWWGLLAGVLGGAAAVALPRSEQSRGGRRL